LAACESPKLVVLDRGRALLPRNKYHMREFIDIMNHAHETSARIEIIFRFQTQLMLEAYKSPATELSLQFRVVYDDSDNHQLYMEVLVSDVSDVKPVIKADYVLGQEDLVVSNVISFRDHKIMHTSMGPQSGAADMGHGAMRWLLREVLKDARARGYHQTQISSQTRFTGARAHQGDKTHLSQEPVNYPVSQKLTEHRICLGPWTILD
jgi:hypothetical protein